MARMKAVGVAATGEVVCMVTVCQKTKQLARFATCLAAMHKSDTAQCTHSPWHMPADVRLIVHL
jgi:hypothetical protein